MSCTQACVQAYATQLTRAADKSSRRAVQGTRQGGRARRGAPACTGDIYTYNFYPAHCSKGKADRGGRPRRGAPACTGSRAARGRAGRRCCARSRRARSAAPRGAGGACPCARGCAWMTRSSTTGDLHVYEFSGVNAQAQCGRCVCARGCAWTTRSSTTGGLHALALSRPAQDALLQSSPTLQTSCWGFVCARSWRGTDGHNTITA